MIGKKINQLATELAPTTTDLTIIGDPVTGVSKKITLEQLGAIFGGAVSFYTTLGDFPATGVIDIIYCAKDTKKLYLWSGSAYVEVFPSQSLLDTYQLRSEKGVSNGYASLDVNGKVPIGQLPNSIMEYKGTWNAATNTPTLANGTGDTGDVYICNAAGTVNFGAGPITFAVGDYVVYSGTIWQRSSGAVGTVTSVGLSITGDSIGVTGSPITTSGTLALAFAGNSTQYINGAGNLVTFPGIINEAQNLITEVYNKTGATLTKGTVVYINGGQGNLPTVTKALATGDSTSAQTYGIVRNNITNNNNGYVVVAGRISDLDTQAYTEGTQLYLSPTTAGTYTSTKPYAPNHLVYVGIVVRAHPTQGVIEVKIQNGYELDELHNVAAQSPDNNDILQYKTATSLWTKVAGTTSNIAEGTNLYYTDARSRAALSFTAGSGAYNSTTGVITIPTNTNQLTNGASFITLASLSAGAGISYNNTTGVIASTITQYTDALARAAISLTTTGTSGAATYNNTTGVLNIPQYQTALTNPVTGTGTTNYLPKFTGTSTIGNSNLINDASGNLGLGVTPSASADPAFQSRYGVFIGNDETNINNNAYFSSGWKYVQTGFFANRYYQNGYNGGHQWLIAPSGTAGNAISFTQAMTLNASGNLSVGNTNDTYRLSVVNNGASAFIGLSNQSGTTGDRFLRMGFGTGISYATIQGTRLNTADDVNIVMQGGGGNVGIGLTSIVAKLQVENASSADPTSLSSVPTTNVFGMSTSPGGMLAAGIGTTGGTHVWLQGRNVGGAGVSYPISLQPLGGNVGIGTTNPLYILDAYSTGASNARLRVQGTTNFALTQAQNSSGVLYMGVDSSTADGFGVGNYSRIIWSSNAYPLVFAVNDAERMRITSGGAVQITQTIQTGAPTNGTAQPWRLGDARSGSISTNSYIIVSVNGTTYSIPALNGLP